MLTLTPRRRGLLVSSVLVAGLLWALPTGCDSEDLFDPCPLSESIEAACEEEQPTTIYTCVVAEHPSCNEQICAAWGESDAFCSRVCESDGECPGGSSCEPYIGYSICVPDEYADS